MTDPIKEKLKVLLGGLEAHLQEFKLYEFQPIEDQQRRTQKLMELQKVIERSTTMMENENNKLSQTTSGLKGERFKQETSLKK